jgi:pyrroloquinoline quinone biosynthesis protein D
MEKEIAPNQPLTDASYPKIAQKARLQIDKVNGKPILLYPEGLLQLNATGAAIVTLCDGRHSTREIVAELAGRYHTTPGALQNDVEEYLQTLYKHALLAFHTAPVT